MFFASSSSSLSTQTSSEIMNRFSRPEVLGASKPGEYLIFCHRTGEKIPVSVGIRAAVAGS
jgi:hypothetical protein